MSESVSCEQMVADIIRLRTQEIAASYQRSDEGVGTEAEIEYMDEYWEEAELEQVQQFWHENCEANTNIARFRRTYYRPHTMRIERPPSPPIKTQLEDKFGILSMRYGVWLRAVRKSFSVLWRVDSLGYNGDRWWLIYCVAPHDMIVGAVKVGRSCEMKGNEMMSYLREHRGKTAPWGTFSYLPKPNDWGTALEIERLFIFGNPITLQKIRGHLSGYMPKRNIHMSEWMLGRERLYFRGLLVDCGWGE